MLTFPKIGFNFIAVTSLVLCGCVPSAYMQPATGDLSTIKFELPQGDKKITIYEKPEQCEGPTFALVEKDETFKEVKVADSTAKCITV